MTTSTTTTRFAISADGTRIAYDVTGTGPALVIVEGALCHRGMGVAKDLTPALSAGCAVFAYDRRGRGESGQGETPYAVQREVEDLVAVCEAPFIVDATHAPNDPGLANRLRAMVAEGDRSGAVKTFLRTVGVPGPVLALMPLLPVWKGLKAVAHTLGNDLEIVLPFEQGEPLPDGYYAGVRVPTLVIAGGKSPEYLRNAQAAIAAAVPGAKAITLPGQTHMVKAKATVPVIEEFFAG